MTNGATPLDARRAGVLMHVTSLPSGSLGPAAYQFVDFLAAAGCSVWQVLPLVPTHEDGSPYSAPSTMAGNAGLVSGDSPVPAQDDEAAYAAWRERTRDWLEPYVEFVTLGELLGGVTWQSWPARLRDRDPLAVADALEDSADRLEELRRAQWAFDAQWQALRAYAGTRGVLVFGDLPIFVSYDSADVWANRHLFELDAEGRPTTVTGVPPDYFAADGQKWNNPHYDWARMAADGFSWWRRRIARQRELFDLVRIDHFRGFEAAWHVPADAPTARDGWWVPGPGRDVVAALVDEAGPGRLVAEDLGIITPEVDALRQEFALPGMKVLQFAFDGSPDNPYLPGHHGELAVVYTGTHDNDTTAGWWASLDEGTRETVRRALPDPGEPMPWALVRLALSSTARLAVVPAQDLLGLDSGSRMNTPGTVAGNWAWRAAPGVFTADLAARLRDLVVSGERLVGP